MSRMLFSRAHVLTCAVSNHGYVSIIWGFSYHLMSHMRCDILSLFFSFILATTVAHNFHSWSKPIRSMESWVGTGEGRARKSVHCVGMSVRVLVIHCGIIQHIEVLGLNFC